MRFAKTIAGLGLFVALACLAQAPYHNSIVWRANQWLASSGPGPTKFIVLASGTNVCATSPNGITWAQQTLPVGKSYDGLAFGAGVLVTVTTNNAAVSTDGTNWANYSSPVAQTYGSYVRFVNDKFFIPTAASANAGVSVDGTNWGTVALPAMPGVLGTPIWSDIAYGNGVYVLISAAIGGNSAIIALSGNITNWIIRTNLPTASNWQRVKFYDGKFLASKSAANTGALSVDGTNWIALSYPTSGQNWKDFAYRNSTKLFLAGTIDQSVYITSTDGTNWSSGTIGLFTAGVFVYGEGVFMAPCYNTMTNITSADGVAWATHKMPSTNSWFWSVYTGSP